MTMYLFWIVNFFLNMTYVPRQILGFLGVSCNPMFQTLSFVDLAETDNFDTIRKWQSPTDAAEVF